MPGPFLDVEAASCQGQVLSLRGPSPHSSQGHLTHRARGRDDSSLRQDFHDARPHRGRAAAVGIQVAQQLLDDQVRVLRLREKDLLVPNSNPHVASEPRQPWAGTQRPGWT